MPSLAALNLPPLEEIEEVYTDEPGDLPDEQTVVELEKQEFGDDPDNPAELTEETETPSEPDYKASHEEWEAWKERWTRDPVGFMQHFAKHMSHDQQAALAKALQIVEPTQPLAEAFEPQSPAEEWLLRQREAIEQIPQFAEAVSKEIAHRDTFIHDALVSVTALEARFEALLEAIETQIPAVDRAALDKALESGKGYRDAVAEQYKPALQKAVKQAKQARKPRPETPPNGSNDTIPIKKGMDMVDIWKLWE